MSFVYLLAAAFCHCQEGFVRSYDFDKPGAIFTNMLLKEDTLIVTGLVFPDEPPYLQGILFAKLDTFGNVLEYKAHFDTLGNNYAVGAIPSGLVRLSDNSGYLLLSGVLETNAGMVMKLDINGNLKFIREYPDNLSLTEFYKKVLEVPDAFLVAGDKFYILGEAEVFILKIDKEGNKLWEKKYGSLVKYDGFSDILQTTSNEFVISAIRNSLQGTPWQQAQYKKWVFAVDSLGSLKWQWESEHSLEEIGINNLHKNGDGNWVYTTTNNVVEFDGYIRTQPRFVIRDSNFNLISSTLYDKPDYSQNYFESMIPMPAGGWLAVGRNNESEPPPTGLFGWMYRLDVDGDSLWSRIDTALWDPGPEAGNSLNSAVVLPSGSIIAAGICETFHPQPKDYGWLIKVDKNGCIDTLNCTPLNNTTTQLSNNRIKIFPNPVQSKLTFESEHIGVWDKIEILNSVGEIVKVKMNEPGNQIDLGGLIEGIYFIRFIKSNKSITKKIIKRR